jgi:hypothetical protein
MPPRPLRALTAPVMRARKPVFSGAGAAVADWFQFRLTWMRPYPGAPRLSSETLSPRFSSVTLDSEILAGAGAAAGDGGGGGVAARGASLPPKCASSVDSPPLKPWPTAPKRQTPSLR